MPDADGTPDIETGADTLLSFLEEKTKWPVSKIADQLGVPEKTVKSWAKALEKSGLVEIKYSAIKGMVLEYASEKSYDELNQGRSELALEADQIEIEAEEIETVEDNEAAETVEEDEEEKSEDSKKEEDEIADTKHAEDENEEDEEENSDKLESLDHEELGSDEESVESADLAEKEDSDGEKLSSDLDEGSLDKDPEEMSEEEGKERLKEELERLEGEKNGEKNEEKPDTAKLNAKKARIKKNSSKSSEDKEDKSSVDIEESEDEEESSDDHESMMSRVEDKVSSSSGSEEVEHDAGENLDEVLENIKDLGDLLRDDEVSNGEVYSRLEQEMDALKNVLVEEEVTDDMKEDVAETMQIVGNDIENATEPKSILSRIKNYLLSIREMLP